MRNVLRILPAVIVAVLIWILSRPIGALPAIGTVLDPVNGLMAAAEPVGKDFDAELKLEGVRAPVEVWLEDRLVPHVRAQNDHDLYFTQGYVHAYFRLWQIDMQTRAAGGRVAEVAGEKAVEFDRGQRRKGMVFGAERSLAAMEADPRTRDMLDAYRDGVNTFIGTLNFRDLPIEYKLMGFRPEKWTNLRSALLLKYMADDLTGKTDDIAFTLLREQLGEDRFDQLFPERIPGSKPVIPEGTSFDPPGLTVPPVPKGEIWARFGAAPTAGTAIRGGGNKLSSISSDDPDIAVGSNNWAVSGSHTASGKPILCNDPHLGLNLPSLWFEIQLTAPGINTYGVSLPGAPGVVIGYNENISWGFTNNYRDVKDFYEIHPADVSGNTYLFNGREVLFTKKVERIGVKGAAEILDTVRYTIHGPVTHDPTFPDPGKTGKMLACTWMAHRGTNELLSLYLVNRAGDYKTFTQAVQHFECPAQNFVYADVAGNIAMWGQGRFINKWRRQGKFVMNGSDSSTLWGESIPMAENPHVLNPPQGYVASANQQVTDSTYPYWYNGSFTEWRSWAINLELTGIDPAGSFPGSDRPHTAFQPAGQLASSKFTTDDMMKLQNNSHSVLSLRLKQTLAKYEDLLKSAGVTNRQYLSLEARSKDATFFQILWSRLYETYWRRSIGDKALKYPSSELTTALLTGIAAEPASSAQAGMAADREGFIRRAIHETIDSFRRIGSKEWYQVKNTSLTHLAKLPAFSYDHLKIGGWGNTINAVSGNHGPSWRMIVEMDSVPKAYAIYPGGQSGNPGSRHYGENVQQWVDGRYNELRFLPVSVKMNPFRYAWNISG